MAISNCLFSPTSKDFFGFSFWYITAQLRIDSYNKTIQYN
jgi:hypothetical protein